MTLAVAFTILCAIYALAQLIGKKTKGFVGAGIVVATCMAAGFWTGLIPKDIVPISKLDMVNAIVGVVITANIGTTFDPCQFKRYWRLTLTVLVACAAMSLMVVGVGQALVGRELAMGCFPTLMGGMVSTKIMTEALSGKGLAALAGIVSIAQSIQSLFGLPVIGSCTRKLSTKVLDEYRSTGAAASVSGAAGGELKKRNYLIDRIPAKYDNAFIHLAIIGAVGSVAAWISTYTAPISGGVLNAAVVAIILSFVLRQLGLIAENPLRKAGVMDFFMFAMVVSVFQNLGKLTPAVVLANIFPIIALFVLGSAGLLVGGFLMAKLCKVDPMLALAASFGAFTGYPLNYQVTVESIQIVTQDPAERKYLEHEIIPCVVLGSVISVTITSVLVASIMAVLI